MSASADIRIVQIPLGLLAEMLPHATPHLVRGMAVSNLDVLELASDLITGAASLWCIFDRNQLSAAFFTSIHEDEAGRFVNIYGFGGHGVRRWIGHLQDVMETHAGKNGCRAVRFYGRPGWGRLVPRYRSIGIENGAAIYERAIA